MATKTESGPSDHVRGILVTTLASLVGVGAGVASGVVVGTDAGVATSTQSLFILGGLLLLEYPILRGVGVDVNDFGPKDHLYVAFMTFTLWFITYAILLTNNTAL